MKKLFADEYWLDFKLKLMPRYWSGNSGVDMVVAILFPIWHCKPGSMIECHTALKALETSDWKNVIGRNYAGTLCFESVINYFQCKYQLLILSFLYGVHLRAAASFSGILPRLHNQIDAILNYWGSGVLASGIVRRKSIGRW